MKNNFFDISFDSSTGTVASIVCPDDKTGMNWCISDGMWGYVESSSNGSLFENENHPMKLVSFEENDSIAKAVFSNSIIEADAKHFFADNGNLVESFTVKNLLPVDVFIEHGNLGIKVPFNDVYTYADDCMTSRCNTHLWCGGNVTYVNALKMGESDINLGLVLTKGNIVTYSVDECESNRRGIFILDSAHVELAPGDEYTIEWEIFRHTGKEDFYKKLRTYPNFIEITAPHYTVFINESIEFSVNVPSGVKAVTILTDGEEVAYTRNGDLLSVSFIPKHIGEYRFTVKADELETYAEFNVSQTFEKLIESRVNFIVDKQQVNNPKSRLDGAYVIYDTEEEYKIFNHTLTCHNACMERLGIALFVARYLESYPDNDKIRRSYLRFVDFFMREVFDAETGTVYGSVGKPKEHVRLYNAPWAATLLTDTYLITNDKKYLLYIPKLLKRYYYDYNGLKFYPNGFLIHKIVTAFDKAELYEEKEFVLECFKNHVENMIKKGISYPKHEVNYEQTIVSPAASFISEMGMVTGDERYTAEAKRHIELLERFNGTQPSFHLYETPIRYWDAFWGGKTRLYGDTFPQYWSCLTARSYKNYYLISKEEKYLKAAEECARNFLCLFRADGSASCAYVYPYRTNGKRAEVYDGWANDQDYALYFAMENELL